jgi:hypothetical protein
MARVVDVASSGTAGVLRGAPPLGSRTLLVCTAALFVLVLAGYANSLAGVFVLDDFSILKTEELHSLWPLWPCLFSQKMVTRPLVGLSLALNYAVSGTHSTLGYHIVNLAVHLLAALTLFGLVRQTLHAPRLAPRFAARATPLALGVAALWAVHPLQTEAVTYIIQRSESMMGLFFLLTLYCAVRSFSAPDPLPWRAGAIAAALLGMGCKQVMVTAPVLVWLHDRTFFAGSFRATARRWPLYLGLACSWIALALLMASVDQFHAAGFELEVSPQQYLLTQFGVIPRYLGLILWPSDLSLHYAWPVARSATSVVPGLLLLTPLLLAIVVGSWRGTVLSYLGVWFFLILAPSSSILPIHDAVAEHRLYLSLAAPSALVVLGGYRLMARLWPRPESADARTWSLFAALVAILIGACALRTRARNEDYRDEARICGGPSSSARSSGSPMRTLTTISA